MTASDTTPDTEAPVLLDLGADLSPALRALEVAYRMIQRRFPGTPDATIVVKRDAHAWGHTTVAKTWASARKDAGDGTHFEIMISGQNLRRGAVYVAATLLHEAAHAHNLAAGVLDVDSNGRHNLKFKARAEIHGLTVENTNWAGWTTTSLGEESQVKFARLIAKIRTGLDRSAAAADKPALVSIPVVGPAGVTVITPPKRGPRNNYVAICGCGFKIRASRGVLEACKPLCQTCSQPFEIAA